MGAVAGVRVPFMEFEWRAITPDDAVAWAGLLADTGSRSAKDAKEREKSESCRLLCGLRDLCR